MSEAMHAGFIGLGTLGRVMASRLLAEGIHLTVWNRTPGKAAGLNAAVAASPAEVVTREKIVILNLFDSEAVASVLTGPSGILHGECRGKIIVDTTTNDVSRAEEFHAMLRERGVKYLESPVLGSVTPARQGALTVLTSGDNETFLQVRPFLERIGKTVLFLGAPGSATAMKLVNNLVLASFMSVLAEAVVLGESAGLARQQVIEILGAGAGNSGVLSAKKEKLLQGDSSPQFSSAAIFKDLRYVERLTAKLGRPLVHLPLEKEIYSRALEKGLGSRDFSAVWEIVKDWS